MTLFFIISNNNILDILLLLELQTFISLILYFLLTNKKYNINEILKLEASIKYFLMSALGSIFIILGCACVYFFFDTFNLIFIKDILYLKFDDINYNYNSNLIFFIIIIGLFIKLGIAPFHQ
jgi:NADH:ubiquinone oxidoreductase subunit 2 (subunit N)